MTFLKIFQIPSDVIGLIERNARGQNKIIEV